jgi:hypothetical protein
MSLTPQQIENLPQQQKMQVIQLKQWAAQNMGQNMPNAPYVEGREGRAKEGE